MRSLQLTSPKRRAWFSVAVGFFVLITSAYGDPVKLGARSPGFLEATVGSQQFLSQGFSLNHNLHVGSIDIFMSGFGTDQFTFWLTDAIGATAAEADVLLQSSIPFPNTGGAVAYDRNGNPYITGQWISIVVELNMRPGDYFIVLSSQQSTPTGDGWVLALPSSIIPSSSGSIGLAGHATPPFGSTNQAFPPASIFENLGATTLENGLPPYPDTPFLFDLRSNIPEPSSLLLLATAGIAWLVFRSRAMLSRGIADPRGSRASNLRACDLLRLVNRRVARFLWVPRRF